MASLQNILWLGLKEIRSLLSDAVMRTLNGLTIALGHAGCRRGIAGPTIGTELAS